MDFAQDKLNELERLGLLRSLREISNPSHPRVCLSGKEVINFSSNDYLGLSQHPILKEAAHHALHQYGTGATASRLVSGSFDIHHQLEEFLAYTKQTQGALSFANGFSTALGTIPVIVGKGDTIILDKLSHACLIDAAHFSGATLRVFPHNDLQKLEKLLIGSTGRVLIVTESVFSMDGDHCPLEEIIRLKNKYGALLFLDEAHAVGILGKHGRGLAAKLGLQDQVDFQMGTLGKALGSAGGYVAASQKWINLFINKARSFVYSTAPPPAQAAASLAALQLLETEEGQRRRDQLHLHLSQFSSPSPIVPVILGTNEAALRASRDLLDLGLLVPAIRYPTVPRGTARLRITLSAAHHAEDVAQLKRALSNLIAIPSSPKRQ